MDKQWLDVRGFLSEHFRRIALDGALFEKDFDPEVRIADPRFGDFQVNGVLGYAKKHKQNPRALGEQLLNAAKNDPELKSFLLELSGPGFINIRISNKFLLDWLQQFNGHCDSDPLTGKTIVVDYSCPNSAKQMHVGHLRSMIIGDAIQRVLKFAGAKVIRDNHIGDWGTQFGILIMAVKRSGIDIDHMGEDAIDVFEQLYKEGVAATKENSSDLELARKELVALQNGDPKNIAIWEKINKVSYESFDRIYNQMDVQFDYVFGESFYRDKVDRVYQELTDLHIAEMDDGALVVFHRDHERFKDQPFLIRKSDGASNYATTDLATVLYRVEEFHADEIIYVTDGRQQDHFQQLFLTVERWFKAKNYSLPELKHVWFGTVLGEDGHAIKTRSGESIKLKQLIEEGIVRAYKVVNEKNSELTESEKQAIARVVAIGAIKYADLSQSRTNDYAFSWDKMLALDGNTVPYLLYAVARICALFRKLSRDPNSDIAGKCDELSTPEELSLARKIIDFPGVIKQVLEDFRPHYLCTYLYELASEFSSFYNANRIFGEPDSVLNKRLLLCQFTLYVLRQGLQLLGIATLEKM